MRCSTTESFPLHGVFARHTHALFAPYVATGAEHGIVYHLLTEGRASGRLEDGERISLGAGEIVVFPHGDPHIIENGPTTRTIDLSPQLERIFCQGLPLRSGAWVVEEN